MRIYFIRHAIAVPGGAPGVADDASRALTPEGIKKMRQQAQGLARMELNLDQIWTSPLVRARQTADIITRELELATTPKVMSSLAPGGLFARFLEDLSEHDQLNDLALVGHEPGLSEFATRLLTGTGVSALRLKKGGAACLEIEGFHAPMRGELCWLLTPKQLRQMA